MINSQILQIIAKIRHFGKTEGTFKRGDGEIDFLIVPKQIATNQSAVITLACTNLQNSYLLALPPDSSTYNLVLFSPHSCVLLYHRGLSTGSVLLIIFFVCLTVYLVGGVLVLHFLRGARGKEMIPNYEFWSGLPSLVRDGFLFLLNGCNPISVPTAESYDRI
ncbi:uncharacterized protein LOC108734927 [Agrilus planipennis]|uniref:Uncharacterized protein LOC108734927 n=1 Tax=Agrilus planipennis TaxID=224129 RepID=A0A1W4WNZ8_AGRPL|nr:uncharacterized protein LOC108734927 [Agrilus planipennis]